MAIPARILVTSVRAKVLEWFPCEQRRGSGADAWWDCTGNISGHDVDAGDQLKIDLG
jgi:hypothetical protein